MAFAQAARRPIEGAVATLGVSDRVAFLRRTYAHLGGALIAFALLTAGMMKYMTETSIRLSTWGGNGAGGMILFLVLFLLVNWGAQRLAQSEASRALQYLGLGIGVLLWSVLAQPIIWFTVIKFGNPAELFAGNELHLALSGKAAAVLGEATVITLAIFIGLTATVFITRKDFTFMRGALSIASFALIGVALASLLFGFHIGVIWSALVILLMAGYILMQTSLVMNYFRPTQHVSAALMLFATIVNLFIQVLRVLAELNRR
jgi:FtsH-binding integral membrane protein